MLAKSLWNLTHWVCVIQTLCSEVLRTFVGVEDDFLTEVKRRGQPWPINTRFTALYTLIRDVTKDQLLNSIQKRRFLGCWEPEGKGHFQVDEGVFPGRTSTCCSHLHLRSRMRSAKTHQNPTSEPVYETQTQRTDLSCQVGLADACQYIQVG